MRSSWLRQSNDFDKKVIKAPKVLTLSTAFFHFSRIAERLLCTKPFTKSKLRKFSFKKPRHFCKKKKKRHNGVISAGLRQWGNLTAEKC